jgi:hypothetical protein
MKKANILRGLMDLQNQQEVKMQEVKFSKAADHR